MRPRSWRDLAGSCQATVLVIEVLQVKPLQQEGSRTQESGILLSCSQCTSKESMASEIREKPFPRVQSTGQTISSTRGQRSNYKHQDQGYSEVLYR